MPESFQTTVNISRVGMAHPDFFQGGPLPTLSPRAGAHAVGPIKMKLATQVGLGTGHIMLDMGTQLPQKGRSPQFSAHV